jgi:hypothetical protein
MCHDTTIVLEHSFKYGKSIYYSLVISSKSKLDIYKQMRVGSTRNTKAIKKQKKGTYAVNIYGWIM